MIRQNLNIVQARLGEVNTKVSVATQYLSKIEKAEEITTLSIEQKTEILDRINDMATEIQTAYNELVTVFSAEEEIIEE